MAIQTRDQSLDKMDIIWSNLPKELIEKFDILDDLQITNSTKGKIIKEFFYEFPSHGKNAISLTYSGIKWIASKMAAKGDPLTVGQIDITETPESIKAVVRVRRYATGEERLGAAEQLKYEKGKDGGEPKADPFAFAKVVSKAQRNGLKQFIPETVIQEAYREWQKVVASPSKTTT